MDFEISNSHLLQGKMFNGRDSRQKYIQKVVRVVPVMEKRINMNGKGYREPEGSINYPENNQKKIFGMSPKTLMVALGVVVVSIWVLSKTGSNNDVTMASGGAIMQ